MRPCLSNPMTRWIAGLILGAAVLWQVAAHAGPSRGRVIVHVSISPADLIVDQNVYHVDRLEQTPVICELRPGRHTARLIQDDRAIYLEEFSVSAGEEVILSAWDRYVDGRSPERAPAACTARKSTHERTTEHERPAIHGSGPLASLTPTPPASASAPGSSRPWDRAAVRAARSR